MVMSRNLDAKWMVNPIEYILKISENHGLNCFHPDRCV